MVLANSPQITGVRGYSRTLTHRSEAFTYRAFTVYGLAFTPVRLTTDFLTAHRTVRFCPEDLTTPCRKPLTGITPTWFRHKSAFARHYSRNHYCFLFLPVLRCFTSRRSLQPPYVFRWRYPHMTTGGFPHSDTLGSQLCWQLPQAYRGLPRPSSAPGAKASTIRP